MVEILPCEVVDLIIDQLVDDRVTLNACSTVCRTWLARSRYHFFHDLLIHAKNCDHILTLPLPSAFSTATRRLMLSDVSVLCPGIQHFASVKSLYLTMSTAGPDVAIRLPLLFTKITSFELNQVFFNAFEDIIQLVCSLPRLEIFTSFMCPWMQELNAPPAHFHLPENLHTLNFVSLRLHVFLEWFNTLETLPQISTVRFYGVAEPHIRSVGASIKRLGNSLQHLTLDLWDDGHAEIGILSDTVDLSFNPNLLSFTLLNGWPKLLQELLLTHTKHSSLQRASLTIYEGKNNMPNLDLLNWNELDFLVTSPDTAFRLTELTIRIYAHSLVSSVTRETVESHFLPRSGAKGLVKYVPERERAFELNKTLTSPVARRSWGERISVEEAADWKTHKAICKGLQRLENDTTTTKALLEELSDQPADDVCEVDAVVERVSSKVLAYLAAALERPLTPAERNLIELEPRCMGCGRSDRLMRMEAKVKGSPSAKTLLPCNDCGMAFYCSVEHERAIASQHAEESEDGHDGSTQCEINQEIRADIRFAITSAAKPDPFTWAPQRVKPSWSPLSEMYISWLSEYGMNFVQEYECPHAAAELWMRAASDGLSMPLSILLALEVLNGKNNTEWTRKDTLMIHVIGASVQVAKYAIIFDEILHWAPAVKKLEILFCGTELSEETIDVRPCPACDSRGRTTTFQVAAKNYQDYAVELGPRYIAPDLAIGFNCSFTSDYDTVETWKKTVSFLIKKKIPSTFTTINKHEAGEQTNFLAAMGAKLYAETERNMWGSALLQPEPNRVSGFRAVNGWFGGAFLGGSGAPR
ncbi:hypothetical protein DXG01_010016 [Tephrocybe rancida]|nr:hypothetical protein DXG01_010016 [Tephrocybe rancida]